MESIDIQIRRRLAGLMVSFLIELISASVSMIIRGGSNLAEAESPLSSATLMILAKARRIKSYSIDSSANARSPAGTAMPSSFAVGKLICQLEPSRLQRR
jgi:hypothetical protein